MLVKLRISNEKEWIAGVYNSEFTYAEQYSELYTHLAQKYKGGDIPLVMLSEYSNGSTCVFHFNGFDSNTNTLFYKFSTAN